LRQGDPAAFECVYEAHRARLHAFLLRLTRDAALARDLAQETWLRLAANARELAPDTEPRAWLFRVARNLFVSQRRWAIAQEAGLAALRRRQTPALPSPLEQAAADELELRLERALAALPLRYREAVLLAAVEGLPAPQIAEILGVTPDSVRQRVARGRAAIRRALEEG
jgi:RNA polymerase sigma-70 factor (ECF subfamily)